MWSSARIRDEVMELIAPFLPKVLREKLLPYRYKWSWNDLRPIVEAPGESAAVRLLIGPANSASQAVYWAKAATSLDGVVAKSLAFGYSPDGITAEPDSHVAANVGNYSRLWALRQRKAIIRDFTHVLYESERPILGALYNGDVAAEIRDLQSAGLKIAMVSHGSDVRTPSAHRRLQLDSPFGSDLDGLTDMLETAAAANHRILDSFTGPKFVSTPDLLQYVPQAQWLPTLTNSSVWANIEPTNLESGRLKVLHVPSRSALKGSQYVSRAMRGLEEEGLIDYVERKNVPYDEMPALVGQCDILIDQVSMGLYGVASIEALLAGRIVVAETSSFVRDTIARKTRIDLPIVEASKHDIGHVVRDIAEHPERYRHLAAEGRDFAAKVHSTSNVAEVLRPFLRQ